MSAKVVLSIVIACVIISDASSLLKGGLNAVCSNTVSFRKSRIIISLEEYREDESDIHSPLRIGTKSETLYYPAWTVIKVCCPGYENKNETCEPRCLSTCENGYCVEPNTCACNPGYQPSIRGDVSVCVFTPENSTTTSNGPRVTRSLENSNRTEGCVSGNCTATGNQQHNCNDGYQLGTNETCVPICGRTCVNGNCSGPDVCTCQDGFQQSKDDVFTCEPKCSESCVFGNCTAPDTCTCNKGYEMRNGSKFTCTPVCNETCSSGNCTAPDTCSCSDGWGGNSCDVAIFCIVAQPVSVNSTEPGNNSTKSNGTMEKQRINWQPPPCRPECLDKLDSTPVNLTRKTSDMIYHFIRLDSSCNVFVAELGFTSKYKNTIGTVLGIVLFAMVIYVAYVATRQIWRSRVKSESMQCLYTNYEKINATDEADETVR